MGLKLRVPQKIAVRFTVENPRAYLNVDMGLGKTLTILEAIDIIELLEGPQTVLVVAPRRVATVSWPSECVKWGRPRPTLLHGAKWPKVDKPGLYCCTFAGLRRLRKETLRGGRKCPFTMVVFDEATAAKDPGSKRINGVRGVFHRNCRRVVAMTGTPISNNLLDIFAQIRLVDGGERLGKAFLPWRNQWFYPEDYQQRSWTPHEKAPEAIVRKISDITLTLRKEDYPELGIPDIIEHDVLIPMPSEIRDRYETIRKDLRLVLSQTDTASAKTAAVLSNKMLQLCAGIIIDDGHQVVPENPFDPVEIIPKKTHWLSDHKTEAIRSLLDGDPSLLIYTFNAQKAKWAKDLGAETSFSESVLDAWNRREVPLLMGYPSSMAHGLNLQKGGERIIYSGSIWSQELYNQANCRLARPGASGEPVHVYRIICENSIEEYAWDAVRGKIATSEDFTRLLREVAAA